MEKKADKSKASADPCRLRVGTSGYAYTEWVEAGFYPPDTSSAAMLPQYARQFAVVELNYTWYQMPGAQAVERQRQKAPPGFRFAAKLTRTLTHEVDADAWPDEATRYRDGIAPLLQAGQLVAVLIQLPPFFDRTAAHRRHLAALLDALTGLPLAVEFRHRSWAIDRVFAELERRRVTLVTVDAPDLPGLFPALDVVTNPDLFYVRFHGRNARGWRSGKMQLQFDYDYTDDELGRWVEEKIVPLAGRARSGVLFFNNHVRGQAPQNARQLVTLLEAAGLSTVRAVDPPVGRFGG
ncbi:MAG: DUF72 domain-containing protein [Desulfobacterales bacterium]|nr:DUF72 domain-containing protein [Desulfobacterales bacterium]